MLNIISSQRNKLRKYLSLKKYQLIFIILYRLVIKKSLLKEKYCIIHQLVETSQAKILSLPFHQNLFDNQIDYIVNKIKNYYSLIN